MAATRGPVPKRSTERRRRNKSKVTKTKTVTAPGTVKAPAVSSTWHPIAKAWFRSLATSGQARYFEPSDWQAARFVAEAMSRNLKAGQRFSAQLFQAVWSAMGDLLTTEGARRRVRIEIEREEAGKPADVTVLDEYRDMLKA